MSFKDDLRFEEDVYDNIIKPYFNKIGIGSIFVRYLENTKYEDVSAVIFNTLQEHDIDIITDSENKNITISIKATRNIWNNIFLETVKNSNTKEAGWYITSKADFIIYVWTDYNNTKSFDKYKMVMFKLKDILENLDINSYKKGVGRTWINNKMAYKTYGRLIPLSDFKHKVLDDTTVN